MVREGKVCCFGWSDRRLFRPPVGPAVAWATVAPRLVSAPTRGRTGSRGGWCERNRVPACRVALAARHRRNRARSAEPLVRRTQGLRGHGARPERHRVAPLAGDPRPGQSLARSGAVRGGPVVRLGADRALRRDPRGGADHHGRHQPHARGQGRRGDGAEPVGAPVERRHHGAAIVALRPACALRRR